MSITKPSRYLLILPLSLVLILLSGCRCDCPVGWQPDALHPIFYGYMDYSAPSAPGSVRLFYPSIDGAPSGAPIQDECCKYPLIILIHGHCMEPDHHEKWFLQAAHLARGGFVVAVPEIPSIDVHPSTSPHPGLTRIGAIQDWVLNEWEHHEIVHSNTGIVGHSFGALLGARFAQGNSHVKAYASLSGVWEDWPSGPLPALSLDIPTLFMRGNDFFGDLFTDIDHFWGSLPQPKHKVVFEGGFHWDYLRAGTSSCESNVGGRGECSSTAILSSELLAMFFERYLGRGSSVDSRIPSSLMPPDLTLTLEQQFYAGGNYLNNLKTTTCEVSVIWNTADGSGTETLP